jgi:hypothetical protein
MSNYYDPWLHAIEIFIRRITQFIVLTLILGFLIWWAWLHFYFDVGILDVTKKAFTGEAGMLRAFLIMCFACSGLIAGWLFSWLMRDSRQKGENYHRGSRIQNN